jgi:hypothetical protein
MALVTLQKLDKELKEVKRDLRQMKSFFYSAPLKDDEGEYRKEFVKKVLSRARSKGPFKKFIDKESFLKDVRSAK